MDRLKNIARSFAFLTVCIFLAGCDPRVRAIALHVGDSLISGSVTEIQQIETANTSGVLPIFNAVGGSGLKDNDYWIPRLSNIQTLVRPDIVFISMGANDSNVPSEKFPGPAGIRDQIDRLLATFKEGARLYWILPHHNVGKRWNAEQYAIVTREILNARDSGKWPTLKVLDFDSWVASRNKDMTTMLADGIHFNAAGKDEWAHMIQHTIDVEFPVHLESNEAASRRANPLKPDRVPAA